LGGKRLDKNDKKNINLRLASFHDWLLPMLMNGQVSVASTSSATNEQLGMVAENEEVTKLNEMLKQMLKRVRRDRKAC